MASRQSHLVTHSHSTPEIVSRNPGVFTLSCRAACKLVGHCLASPILMGVSCVATTASLRTPAPQERIECIIRNSCSHKGRQYAFLPAAWRNPSGWVKTDISPALRKRNYLAVGYAVLGSPFLLIIELSRTNGCTANPKTGSATAVMSAALVNSPIGPIVIVALIHSDPVSFYCRFFAD